MTETNNPSPSSMAASGEATFSSSSLENASQPPPKKKRSLPGMPDPDAEVIALSPTTLMATNRFVCEICKKGFQRDQNLQLHRRGHNLPWKLRQRSANDVRKKVYVCPEPSCVHHHASRALGDLTGIKKHFSRKHGEKKWKCERCSKQYAVQSDWKAHMKSCGTREYRCDCGTFFSRRDSFLTHRAFCDALAEEARAQTLTVASPSPPPPPPLTPSTTVISPTLSIQSSEIPENPMRISPPPPPPPKAVTTGNTPSVMASSTISAPSSFSNLMSTMSSTIEPTSLTLSTSSLFDSSSLFQDPHYITATTSSPQPPALSATALLQKAAQMGAASSNVSFFHGLALPTSSSTSSTSAQDHTHTPTMTWNTFINLKQDNLGLGLASGNNNNAPGFADVMMGSADPFGGSGQPIMTRDLLGLSIGTGVSSLPSFFTSFGGNFQASEKGGGGVGH